MKTRTTFVSNSSSSSFVVISEKEVSKKMYDIFKAEHEFEFFVLGDTGTKEFGWETERYDGFYDKMTWAALQALYQNTEGNDKYIKLINEVLLGLGYPKDNIIWEYLIGDYKMAKAYIDHQSTIDEAPDNDKIFDSKETLERFLFNEDSYVQGGNDNE